MNIRIDSSKLTDAPYTKETENSFLFDDQIQLEQFVLELQHGNAGAYLISGYRGSGKTSFVNRLQEKLQDFVFVELNIAKVISYPILVKRVIRQLYLQYQAYCTRNNKAAEDFMPEFQLLYDRTFNDIVNTNLRSQKTELKQEREWKVDLQKLAGSVGKLIGPALISLIVSGAMILQAANWLLLLPLLLIALIWGATTAWTITRTRTETTTASADVTRKSLYDDEIAEHHLFDILKKIKAKGINMVIVFDELDKLAEDKNIKDIVNDIKPMLLSGYASFIVVAGQSLYYDLEKSAYLDDIVISTLFSRTIHVAFLKNSSLQKFCLNLIQHEPDKMDELVTDYFDSLILQSGRIPRKLVNMIRGQLSWQGSQALIVVDETKKERLRWRSRVLQAAAAVVDSDLSPRARNIVQQDFFTAQAFTWLSKMLTFDSVGFRKKDIYSETAYGEAYPPAWLIELGMVWDALWTGLKKDQLLAISENDDPLETRYSWIFELPVIPPAEEEEVAETDAELPDQNEPPRSMLNTAGQENHSRFIGELAELENYLHKIYQEVIPGTGPVNTEIKSLAQGLISQRVLPTDWLQNSAVANILELRNRVTHGLAVGQTDLEQIRKASSSLIRIWADINEQYTVFVLNKKFKNMKAKLTTQGGFNILGQSGSAAVALEVRTFRDRSIDPRMFAEGVDKYGNYVDTRSQRLLYAMLIFQPLSHDGNVDSQRLFMDRVRNTGIENANALKLAFINMKGESSIRVQIEAVIQGLTVPPAT